MFGGLGGRRTDGGALTRCELGEEIWVLMPFVIRPGLIGLKGIEERIFYNSNPLAFVHIFNSDFSWSRRSRCGGFFTHLENPFCKLLYVYGLVPIFLMCTFGGNDIVKRMREKEDGGLKCSQV